MSRYYGGRGRSSGPRENRWMSLKFAGVCKVCGVTVAAGETGFYDYAAKTVTCYALECCREDGLTREEWQGSPVSGGYVTVRADSRLGDGAPVRRPHVANRCTHIDYPCCGCGS